MLTGAIVLWLLRPQIQDRYTEVIANTYVDPERLIKQGLLENFTVESVVNEINRNPGPVDVCRYRLPLYKRTDGPWPPKRRSR